MNFYSCRSLYFLFEILKLHKSAITKLIIFCSCATRLRILNSGKCKSFGRNRLSICKNAVPSRLLLRSGMILNTESRIAHVSAMRLIDVCVRLAMNKSHMPLWLSIEAYMKLSRIVSTESSTRLDAASISAANLCFSRFCREVTLETSYLPNAIRRLFQLQG